MNVDTLSLMRMVSTWSILTQNHDSGFHCIETFFYYPVKSRFGIIQQNHEIGVKSRFGSMTHLSQMGSIQRDDLESFNLILDLIHKGTKKT